MSLQDAMETTAQSEDKDIAEELLRFFVDSGEKECFAALLFTCYDLIKPDVALEVRCCPASWRSTIPAHIGPVRVAFRLYALSLLSH